MENLNKVPSPPQLAEDMFNQLIHLDVHQQKETLETLWIKLKTFHTDKRDEAEKETEYRRKNLGIINGCFEPPLNPCLTRINSVN